MLISKVVEGDEELGEGEVIQLDDNSQEYRTANELFELMAKDQNFDTGDANSLPTQDLVLLYKNIDLGTRLMSDANQVKIRKPNQHVENVVHNDENDSDESVINEIYSNEDLHSVFMINNERIDLLNSTTWTSHNTLCQKNDDLGMKSSSMKSEYEKHFLFHDPYIKEQLQNLRSLSSNTNELVNSVNTLVPPSLLDYICCKRLEDNYNFYMDNIIRYVQNTIEQLKRISNGDYLTDKVKEKWREVGPNDAIHGGNTKVLATSTSIPLHVERKSGGKKSTWDDIVHSEVDVRSLSKILEKRIILEIPKLVCSSFTFLTERSADNLIISCKKENNTVESNESRVNVIFQLHRSETGQVMSNINSLMIVQSKAAVQFTNDTLIEEIQEIPLPYKKIYNDDENIETKESLSNTNDIYAVVPAFSNVLYNINDANVENRKVDDVSYTENANGINLTEKQPFGENSIVLKDSQNTNDQNEEEYLDCDTYDNESEYTITTGYQESSYSSNMEQNIADDKKTNENVTANNIIPPNDLLISIQQFTSQKPLPEENEDLLQALPKKKSPTRVRIKSPYENKSYYIEEKKRKKLLEIRERRERNKKALAEKCRVSKHKYGKATVMPQSSNSVTKLSITNKSFYDSIYGQNNNALKESKQIKVKNETSLVKREVLEVSLPCVGDDPDSQNSVATKHETKYANRNYYSDNTETEMMFTSIERNEKDDKEFSIDSVAPNDIHMKLIKQRVATFYNVLNNNSENKENVDLIPFSNKSCEILEDVSKAVTSRNIHFIVPSNTPDEKHPSEVGKDNSKKAAAPVECRKSIDKIYDLLNKLGKSQEIECKLKSKFTANCPDNLNFDANVSQGSDSGTSLKHHASSSNASYFSIEKGDHPDNLKQSEEHAKELAHLKVKIPKEPMTSNQKFKEKDKTKERKRTIGSPIVKIRDNPLKAISQLLHNFENVQKNHHRNIVDQKLAKKPDTSADVRGHVRKNPKYQSHVDGQNEAKYRLKATPMPKEKLKKSVMDVPKIPFQQTPVNDKHDKGEKKKISDMLDEVKEARGEAVRGPSKFSSRLNSLAQPKRVYVQAHSEEYQSKYGRNLMADRLQRLAAATPTERNIGSAHSRTKSKKSLEPTSMVLVKQATPGQQLGRPRSSGTQVREILNQPGTKTCSSVKQNVPESPETLIKKMVEVESYVKHHYGHALSTARGMEETKRLSSTSLLSDIELASLSSSPSLEVPTEIGRQLNDVVSNIIMVNHQNKHLEVLPKSINESRTNLSNYRIHGNRSLLKNLYEDCRRKDCAEASIENQFDDKNSYVVVPQTEKKEESVKNEDKHNVNIEMKPHKSDMQPFKSLKDMNKVQHALHRRLSVGTFQKRLRNKDITLTPNHSMQQMFVLQSGDTASLVLKTTLSSSLREKKINNLTDLNNLPALSATHFNWSSAQIPMQIATVGYVIPEYNSSQYTPSILQLYKVAQAFGSKSILAKPEQDKDIQCYNVKQLCLKDKDSKETNCSSNALINSNQKQYGSVVIEREPIVNGHQYSSEPDYDLQTHNSAANETKDINTSTAQTDIDVTKSLDVLVGLLNEIQKITTCQTKLTKPDTVFNGDLKEIETILNNAETMEHSNKSKLISTTSLDKLQQLKCSQSQSSIYELYLSDNHKFERSSRMNLNLELQNINETGCKDAYVDLKNQCDDRFTEVPSIMFPVSISYGTNVSESMLVCGSMHSVISCSDFRSVCSDHSENLEYVNNLQLPIISEQKMKTRNRISGWLAKLNSEKAECKSINSNMGFKNSDNRSKKKIALLKNANISKRNYYCCLNDPNMNVKRDILVTFYSILVFTVFAALSFPEFMYGV